MFCFSNAAQGIIILRLVYFKFRLNHTRIVRVIHEEAKGQISLGPYLGKRKIEGKEVY